MASELGVASLWPCSFRGTALMVIVVPLDRSRPSPTLNLSCQLPGFPISPPMITANMTISRPASTARYRHGREVTPGCLDWPPAVRDRAGLLLGDATCACPSVCAPREEARRDGPG